MYNPVFDQPRYMKTDTAARKYLKDYRPPDFTIDRCELEFVIGEDHTRVQSRLHIRRLTEDRQAPLKLDGVGLKLIDVMIDEEFLDDPDFSYDGNSLTIPFVPHDFLLQTTVEIDPASNTRLEGLYKSNGNYCTQCEAEGFRHITFYVDRPDVMAVFTTVIRADKASCPVLLSNGNKIDAGEDGDRHWVKWHDPYPKPSYLFALVAGDLACKSGSFTTRSGREVRLEFYSEPHNIEQCDFALESLQKAMRWDEERFGLEYDLDLYMVVAVDDFNMGAMENKGLNVFNTQYVLADPQTATDDNYLGIEGVIGHEYFHNWTGNRVTLRDWFQLSLKEGLTVFRDQEFSADMMSRAIQRINDVRALRSYQFPEDAGPMAHPVRPSSYVEINNFYTVTVYEKGAEVVRMYQTLLGRDGFRKGMDLYFQRHDGQAVTTDDFRQAMADANEVDLSLFQRWYDQAGTPKLYMHRLYDPDNRLLTLKLRQEPGQTQGIDNEPFLIPFRLSLFTQDGQPLPLNDKGDLELTLGLVEAEMRFQFRNIPEMPLVSALRDFSAPVILHSDLKSEELARLMTVDTDPFNQWDAGQQYATRVLLELIEGGEPCLGEGLDGLLDALGQVLANPAIENPLKAEMLALPDEDYLAEMCEVIDVHKIMEVREFALQQIAERHEKALLELYRACDEQGDYVIDPESAGKRRLKNACLAYLTRLGKSEYEQLAVDQFHQAGNMTDRMGSLRALVDRPGAGRDALFDDFYQRVADNPLVLNKWFSLLASSRGEQALEQVMALAGHPDFTLGNPNRARSLLGPFSRNVAAFHERSGAGYAFLADQILELDSLNPQIAARMARAFLVWKKLPPELGEKMKAQILRILSKPDLSPDVAELMQSALAHED